MSSKGKITFAINNIVKNLDELKTVSPDLFDKTFKTLGFTKVVYERCYALKLYRLSDIANRLDQLAELYDYDGDKLITLSRNVRKVFKNNNRLKKVNKTKGKTTKAITKKKPPLSSNDRFFNELIARTNDKCCLCVTFKELSKISQRDFVSLMKKQYPNICEYKLSKEKVESWRDEYNQIVNKFIPIFKEHDKNILHFHIIFELKLPKFTTNLESGEYVYSDAVIVGDDGFVVLEFKQRDRSDPVAIDCFCTQALKYIKRLRFHKIGRHQQLRYTYLVLTKEPEINVWIYKNKKDFWFGHPIGIAEDICTEFFGYVNPVDDIKEWLTAGFKEKKTK